jgi:uncharacterized protein YutE (UPF0331/DUF86 family)
LTDQSVILQKLVTLREHLSRIRKRRPADLDAFVQSADLQDAVALNLLVAAQEAIDVAMHIAADSGWGVASSNREAFELLARHGVIDQSLSDELAGVVAVRNRIAHGYASLDPARFWNELPMGLDALARYVMAIATFVDTK